MFRETGIERRELHRLVLTLMQNPKEVAKIENDIVVVGESTAVVLTQTGGRPPQFLVGTLWDPRDTSSFTGWMEELDETIGGRTWRSFFDYFPGDSVNELSYPGSVLLHLHLAAAPSLIKHYTEEMEDQVTRKSESEVQLIYEDPNLKEPMSGWNPYS